MWGEEEPEFLQLQVQTARRSETGRSPGHGVLPGSPWVGPQPPSGLLLGTYGYHFVDKNKLNTFHFKGIGRRCWELHCYRPRWLELVVFFSGSC